MFRLHLLQVVKRALADLKEGKLSRFYLDGQAIVIEDILELEPDLATSISELMHTGELAAGPWYVLPDQMLVSGESLIRNLQIGIETVQQFGTPALIGYNPDTFGHSHDLPRILQGFSIETAFVWRGVPELSGDPLFWWQSPDGSRVLTWLFSRGYYQTLLHECTGSSLEQADRLSNELLRISDSQSPGDGTAGCYSTLVESALFPCGADHTAPPRNVSLVEAVNACQQELHVELVQLSNFADKIIQSVSAKPVALLDRELRDNRASKFYCNAFLLPGVLSTRLYLKRQNRQSEYRLARFAEPLCAIIYGRGFTRGDKAAYPSAALSRAWKLLLRNHPHDSICGCSVDEVHREMEDRTMRLNQIIDTVCDSAAAVISGVPLESALSPFDPDRSTDRFVIANPSNRRVSAPIPFTFFTTAGGSVNLSPDHIQLRSKETNEELFSGWGRVPYYKFADRYQGWYWAEDIPEFSITSHPWPITSDNLQVKSAAPPVVVKQRSIDNGLLRVSVTPSGAVNVLYRGESGEQTFSLVHEIHDRGDGGDTYNFDPLQANHAITAEFKCVDPGLKGPLVGSLVLTYQIRIPASLSSGTKAGSNPSSFVRSTKKNVHVINTEITLKRGGRVLHFDTSWINASADHRLEVHLHTGARIQTSYSENHFSLTERVHSPIKQTLPVERGNEALPDRFPCQRFVVANNQTFFNSGLPEYGICDRAIALTILRSVGILSRGPLRTRGGGAGPHVPTPGAQCLGPNKASYGWAPLAMPMPRSGNSGGRLNDQLCQQAYDLAEEYETEFLTTFARFTEAGIPEDFSLLRSLNDNIKVVALFAVEESGATNIYARLLNVSQSPQHTKLFINSQATVEACQLNLSGREELPVYRDHRYEPEYVKLTFTNNQLRTIRLVGRIENGEPGDFQRPPQKHHQS